MDNSPAPATTEQLPDIIDRIQAWWITSSLDEGASLSSGVMMIPSTEYRRERLTTWIREMGRPAAIAALRAHAKSPAEIAELEKAAQEQAEAASAPQTEAPAAPATCEAYVLRTPGEGETVGTCDAPAVGLRYNPVSGMPDPVCAAHQPEIVTTPTPARVADHDDSPEVPTTAQVRRAVAGSGWRDVTVAGFDAWLAARDARPTGAPQPTAVPAAGFIVVDNGDAYEAEGGDTFWRECFCTDGKHAVAHRRDTTDDVHQAMTWARNSGAHVLELQAYVVVIELQL